MRTKNSIDLTTATDKCFASIAGDGCAVRTRVHEECGTYMCPLYKPEDCGDWVRVEDKDGVNLIPPEEYLCMRNKTGKSTKQATWKITSARCAE
mgnify:CR=1 FL=1